MDWWRHYLVRYLLGNIVGSVIVGYYFSVYGLWNQLDIGFDVNQSSTSEKLIILAILGFAYCYISSVPILIFHAGRNLIYSKRNSCYLKFILREIKEIDVIFLLIISFVFFIVFAILYINFYVANSLPRSCVLFFNDVNNGQILLFFIVKRCFCFLNYSYNFYCIPFVLITLAIWFVGFAMVCNRKKYYSFLLELSKKRVSAISENQKGKPNIQDSDFVESYKHLREHGNAFFIVIFELILLPVFLSSPYQDLPVIIALWIAPGAIVWWFATWIEVRFAHGHPKGVDS